jgi:hypothetical protein
MQRVPFLLLAMMLTVPGSFGQTRFLRLEAGALLNVPKIAVLANDNGYTVKGGRPGAGFGVHYVHLNRQNWGVFGGCPGHNPAVRDIQRDQFAACCPLPVNHLAPLLCTGGSPVFYAPVVCGLPAW